MTTYGFKAAGMLGWLGLWRCSDLGALGWPCRLSLAYTVLEIGFELAVKK